jgi:hypothetical protein
MFADDESSRFDVGYASPLAVVHRLADGTLRPAWLGRAGAHLWEATNELDPVPPLVGREPALYAAVLADPDDRGPRDVLRDAWLLRNDARGEFAALVFARPTDATRARAGALVLEHGRAWLGRLQPVVPLAGALFDRGPFVRRAVVVPDDPYGPYGYGPDARGRLAAISDAHEWATLEEITFAVRCGIVTPAMKNLRSVGPIDRFGLASFGTGTWRVEELEYSLKATRARDEAAVSLEALAALQLPLRRLRLLGEGSVDVSALTRAAWWSELERLELWLDSRQHESDTDAALAGRKAFRMIAPKLPARCTLAIGALTRFGERSGWMIAGERTPRRLELRKPDARRDQGPEWAAALDLPLLDDWRPDADWMHFALGVTA